MTAPATIAAIRASQWIEFCTGKMFATGAAVPGSAEYPYLVNEIAFLHWYCFCNRCKYSLREK